MTLVNQELLDRFKSLCIEKGLNVEDPSALVEELSHVMDEYVKHKDDLLYSEMKNLSTKVDTVKLPNRNLVSEDMLSRAKEEINAVIERTESATDGILDSAEFMQSQISKIDDSVVSGALSAEIDKIFENCNFQDLTGQTLKKVLHILGFVEETFGEVLKILIKHISNDLDENSDSKLMSGPQITSEAPSQDDIDKLFDEA